MKVSPYNCYWGERGPILQNCMFTEFYVTFTEMMVKSLILQTTENGTQLKNDHLRARIETMLVNII